MQRHLRAGRLHRVFDGVYAVGHRSLSSEGRLAAALLHAGPGAALSHLTAGWWWRLLSIEPSMIHLSTRRRISPTPALRIHRPRDLERHWHRGLPVTGVPRTLLDCAALLPIARLRRSLAEAEYLRLATLDEIRLALGSGHPGSAALRKALDRHQPRLARTLSVLEERFLALCERSSIPLPEVNVTVAGMMVDALWRHEGVVVELDGHLAHDSRAAIERDRHRDLALRANGYRVLRYTWQQVIGGPEAIAADLRSALAGV